MSVTHFISRPIYIFHDARYISVDLMLHIRAAGTERLTSSPWECSEPPNWVSNHQDMLQLHELICGTVNETFVKFQNDPENRRAYLAASKFR